VLVALAVAVVVVLLRVEQVHLVKVLLVGQLRGEHQ
jgi:hypothetical protein